ncbi:unnamed protein product [Linum tenue]|uniref:Protein SHORTAGE IN CHIASMATA 1 n=1 Tax=Linum tenue TaxID=586396 RepID=A0AAV0J0R3_9ROSI|nr:unnamed protein product [Linum tenue]
MCGVEKMDEEEDNNFVADESTEGHEVILFEAPEVDAFVGERHSSVKGLQCLSEVSYTDNKLDLPIPGLPMQHYHKIQESIYSVVDVSLEYDINQMPYTCEDDGSMQGRTSSNHNLFPTLEDHETNLRTITDFLKEHRFLSLLESMETQTASNEMEAFGSVKCDIFEVPSDHCISKECINSEVISSDSMLLVDNITIVDTLCYQEGSAVCSFPTEPITFEELEFVGTHSSQLCEIFFNMKKSIESENCDLMIQKELKFRNLNELNCLLEYSCLEDLDSHTRNLDMELSEDGKPILDFILSDFTLFKTDEYQESLILLPEGLPGSSSMCPGGKFPKPSMLRQLDAENGGKASALFKFMSQLNDLDLFLNPGKATAKERKKGPSEATDQVSTLHPFVPSAVNSKCTQGSNVSGPVTVVVVNTQNFDKEMIVSRRSVYNKIPAMEKDGKEVVERDIDLPVDVLMNSAMCLAWSLRGNSSSGLYAAAAGLGIDLQIFCSYSSELTSEIILSSVLHATKASRSICPKMPESETIAETFLTKFPSINPLTAHAMLSFGGTLVEFLEYSNERRILALQQHRIPDESISLFTNSDKYHLSPHSERKRRKYVHSPPKMDTCMEGEWQFQLEDEKDCWTPDVKEILDELRQSISHLADFSGHKQKSNANVAFDSSGVPKPYDAPQHSRAAKGSDVNENRCKDFMGDILDLTNSSSSENEIPPAKKSVYFRSWLREEDQDLITRPKAASKLAYGGNSLFSFPTASEINPETDLWESFKDHGESSSQEFKGFYDNVYNQWKLSSEDQSTDLKEFPAQRSRAGSSVRLPPEEMPNSGPSSLSRNVHSETPLSIATHSSEPQTSSPWTMEFLSGIRERSRLRKLSLQSDISPAALGYAIDVSKGTKRKSPSVVNFFKYQGHHTRDRRSGPMKQKPPTWSSSASRIGRVQTLSFANNGSGSQTRLVWTDGGVRRLNKRMRNQ